MKSVRVWLLLFVAVAFLAAPAIAEAAKDRTRMEFYGASMRGGWLYGYDPRVWSLNTTSVPAVTVKGRLLHYAPKSKRWLGVAYSTVYEDNDWRVARTDSRGFFKLKLKAPRYYKLYYVGNIRRRACNVTVWRYDHAATEIHSMLTTSSVDASNTRVSVAVDYRYNYHVDELTPDWVYGAPGVTLESGLIVGEYGVLYANDSSDYIRELGVGRSEWSCVLPNDLLAGRALGVEAEVRYANPSIWAQSSQRIWWAGRVEQAHRAERQTVD